MNTIRHPAATPRDVLQIVLTGTPHDQFVLHHCKANWGATAHSECWGRSVFDQLAQARSIKRGPSQPSTRRTGPELMAHKPHFTRTTAVAHQTWARKRRRRPRFDGVTPTRSPSLASDGAGGAHGLDQLAQARPSNEAITSVSHRTGPELMAHKTPFRPETTVFAHQTWARRGGTAPI